MSTPGRELLDKLWSVFEKDYSTWGILADALEESGQEDMAECLRKYCPQGKRPDHYTLYKNLETWDW